MENQVIIPNGTFTVRNLKKGTHRTVKIHTARRGKLEGQRIISLMTGPDNVNNYKGFGFVNDNNIRVWKKNEGNRLLEFLAQTVADWTMGRSEDYSRIGVELMISKRCIRCNRKLTTPESIEAGIGPECAGRL